MATNPATISQTATLKSVLEAALPSGFDCKFRYIHTPAKECDPLFAAPLGADEEKTRLSSHFIAVSTDASLLAHSNGIEPSPSASSLESSRDVISFAIEVLVYSSRRLTTLFVSKVDSTSYIARHKPSPVKTTITKFLQWLADQERHRHPARKVVISLFARAQAQYLFPGSSENGAKHVLDDRQLIKWWARVLDPIIPEVEEERSRYQGYLIVPGYDSNELRSFMPSASRTANSKPRWLPGHPLLELAQTRGVPESAPPRYLLPRFPDDPKARFMQDLDEEIGIAPDAPVTVSPSKRKNGKWNSVEDLTRFWEAMEFRQECSSGRAVGFLWLVISPMKDIEIDERVPLSPSSRRVRNRDTLKSSPSAPRRPVKPAPLSSNPPRRKPLRGPIIPRQPRIKGVSSSLPNSSNAALRDRGNSTPNGAYMSQTGYDTSMQVLVHLDFATLANATQATAKWVSEVSSLCGLSQDFGVHVTGQAVNAAHALLSESTSASSNGSAPVNDLGNMIRKKRKAPDDKPPAAETSPVPNVLDAAVIRKKPK